MDTGSVKVHSTVRPAVNIETVQVSITEGATTEELYRVLGKLFVTHVYSGPPLVMEFKGKIWL